MKCTAYLRVAYNHNGKATIAASAKPQTGPLKDSYGDPFPTVCFAVKLDIPASRFREAEQIIATLALPEAETVEAAVEYTA
jgi:hypothetical protein